MAAADRLDVREPELQEILTVFAAVAERPDRVVLITGEAGIGKTHLARRVAERLAADGFGVSWGRADPVERAVSYAAIAQALSVDPAGQVRAGTAGADAVLHEVYRPFAAMIEERCAARPHVVAIDDLHFADEDTLMLLGFLVRRLERVPVMWLFTTRTRLAEPSPGMSLLLHRLRQDDRLEEVALERLDEFDVARLVRGVVDGPLDDRVLDVVTARAAGNPFFAIQLALSLAEADLSGGTLDQSAALPSISRRTALLERIFPLGEGARTVARLASVCGDVDLDQLDDLARGVGLDVGSARDGFDRLVRADLLRARPDGRYAFVHDLVRETVYEDIGPAERRHLHGVTAEVLLDCRASGVDVDLVELAHHLALGAAAGDVRAVAALREAGDRLVRTAPRSAAQRYRDAIGHLPRDDAGDDLYVRLARALSHAGDPAEVVRVCRLGLMTARDVERNQLTRYLATALADSGAWLDALAVVDAEPSADSSPVLLTTRSLLLRHLEDFDGAAMAVQQALDTAQTVAERLPALLHALNLGVDVGGPGRCEAALVELERMLPSLPEERRLLVHTRAAATSASFGFTQRAIEHLAAADAMVAEGAVDTDWPATFSARVAIDYHLGRYDEALETYDREAPEFIAGLRLLARNWSVTPVSDIAVVRHDTARATRLVDDIVELSPQCRQMKALARSNVDRIEARYRAAAERLEPVLRAAPAAAQFTVYLLRCTAECRHLAGDRDRALELLEQLRASVASNGTILTQLVLAMVDARLRDDAGAAEHGLHLAATWRHPRYEPVFRFELGRLGVDPAVNLTAAHAGFMRLGAVDDIPATEAQMRRHGVRVTAVRGSDRFELSHAERSVAELVAEGLTNRAIAERLAYSVKTIEAYLSRAYAKTGCSNRVELTRFMTEQAGERVSGS